MANLPPNELLEQVRERVEKAFFSGGEGDRVLVGRLLREFTWTISQPKAAALPWIRVTLCSVINLLLYGVVGLVSIRSRKVSAA